VCSSDLEDTTYDAAADKGSVLTGDASALRLDSELPYLLSGRFSGAGRVQSLPEVGIHLKDDGTLQLNQEELQAKFAADPQAVQDFFTKKDVGFSARFGKLIEQLSGRDSSMLDQRSKALEGKISDNEARIDFMNKRLETQQERLYSQFYNMELAVGKLQSQLSVINSIKPLEPLTSSSNQSY
jgi:flagellar hook-associated protein 2